MQTRPPDPGKLSGHNVKTPSCRNAQALALYKAEFLADQGECLDPICDQLTRLLAQERGMPINEVPASDLVGAIDPSEPPRRAACGGPMRIVSIVNENCRALAEHSLAYLDSGQGALDAAAVHPDDQPSTVLARTDAASPRVRHELAGKTDFQRHTATHRTAKNRSSPRRRVSIQTTYRCKRTQLARHLIAASKAKLIAMAGKHPSGILNQGL